MVNPSRRQRGLTYLMLLLAVALIGGVLAAGATVWSQVQRREREKQLLWAGGQIRKAISAYSAFSTDADKRYPLRLSELLLDARSPARRRFLRQIYEDPMMRSTDWGLIRNAQGGIVGVYSRSTEAPLKTGRFAAEDIHFERARSYGDWRFAALVEPPTAAARAVAGRAEAASAAGLAASGALPETARPAASAADAAVPPATAGDDNADPASPPGDEPADAGSEPDAAPPAPEGGGSEG